MPIQIAAMYFFSFYRELRIVCKFLGELKIIAIVLSSSYLEKEIRIIAGVLILILAASCNCVTISWP